MRIFNKCTLLVFALATALIGCSGEWSSYPPQSVTDQQVINIIDIGDTVQIYVFDQPSLTGNFNVSGDGTISLPLLKTVHIAGLTAEAAADKITTELTKSGYLVNPKVTLSLSQTQTVMILGEVITGGEYTYKDGMTILDLVAKSGGFSYRANQNTFDIVRKNQNGQDNVLPGSVSTRIQPGDLIRVRERYF